MRTARRLALLVCAVLPVARPARAQDSQLGIAALGTPGREESVRARTTGGAFAAFDPTSALAEAALAEIHSLTSSASTGTSYRQVQATGLTTWLRDTRYPLVSVGGPLTTRLYFGGGFSTYLDRTYAVVTRDSVMLRGTSEPYTDHITSTGGVSDVRLAAAVRVGKSLALGVGLHLLTGSTQETATRRFDDTTSYATVVLKGAPRYDGVGVSGSALVTLTSRLSLIGFARSDGHLSHYTGDTLTARTTLPSTVGGGLRWTPAPSARLAASVMWRSWSRTSANAFNTVSWSAGLELGGAAPLRLGVRGGQLPFGPGTSAPTELGVSAGTGRSFAKGRGFLDVGVERLARDAPGLAERVWTVLVGITVRP